MQLTTNENTFLNMIKKTCIDEATKNSIVPSVVAVLGIVISNWGTSKEFYYTRNIYLIPADGKWYGKCYSKTSGKVYDRVADCQESATILYRVYDDHRNSIKDFISILAESRRSENGPLRYGNIVGKTEYKDVINILVRDGFMHNYLNRIDDIEYISTLISIIEKYGLFSWDDSLKEAIKMSNNKKRYHNNNYYKNTVEETVADEEETEVVDEEETTEEIEEVTTVETVVPADHMYRVRLDWDKRDTQIFASPSYEDAKAEALKHEGYKIYIDDDGELFEDPWQELRKAAEKAAAEAEADNYPKPILHVLQGEPVVLNNTPIYKSSIDKSIMMYLSGTFYFYDSTVANGRAKITKYKEIYDRNPRYILGYINV